MESKQLPDLQNQKDDRGVALDRVGITSVLFPIKVRKKVVKVEGDEKQRPEYAAVSAKTELYVGLPQAYKGVNVSRFMECLIAFSRHTISSHTMPDLLILLKEKLKSDDPYARFEFDYYIDKTTPVSKITAPQAYRCAFTGIQRGEDYVFILEVNVIAASLCPCSREMSLLEQQDLKKEFNFSDIDIIKFEDIDGVDNLSKKVGMGAHNQRSQIKVQVISKKNEIIWIEDLVSIIEAQASAPTYPILKRPDERFVTELAYGAAKFSEDIARDVHVALEKEESILQFSVKVRNEESIHPYDVVSYSHSDNWNYHI